MLNILQYRCILNNIYVHTYITIQAIALQNSTTGEQQRSVQHLTVANNADTQENSDSAQHQPTVQYALPNKRVVNNKDQKVVIKIELIRYWHACIQPI